MKILKGLILYQSPHQCMRSIDRPAPALSLSSRLKYTHNTNHLQNQCEEIGKPLCAYRSAAPRSTL